jgi:hypothetical protein
MPAILTLQFELTVQRQMQKPAMLKKADKVLMPIFLKEKKHLLKEFDKHDVTKELSKEEPEKVTKSKFLDYGNLFSLLGIDQGTDVPDIIRQVLESSVRVNKKTYFLRRRGDTYTFALHVRYPTADELSNATSVSDWTTRGITELIEKGTPGFSRYLFLLVNKFKNSRSGTAIQLKKRVLREGRFEGTPYVNDLLRKFAKGIRE